MQNSFVILKVLREIKNYTHLDILSSWTATNYKIIIIQLYGCVLSKQENEI